MQTINENSTGYVVVNFYSKTGEPEAPNTVVYRIEDVATGQMVRADTTITAPDSELEIVLSPTDNAIINRNGDNETRRITVTGHYGPTDQVTDEYFYEVRNLKGITTP